MLENAGYSVLVAQSGFDGVKIFASGIVDAVILDYAMPFSEGALIAAQIREIKGDVPILLHSRFVNIDEEDLSLFNRVSPHTAISTLRKVLPSVNGKRDHEQYVTTDATDSELH